MCWCEQRGYALLSLTPPHLLQVRELVLKSRELMSWPSITQAVALGKADPVPLPGQLSSADPAGDSAGELTQRP